MLSFLLQFILLTTFDIQRHFLHIIRSCCTLRNTVLYWHALFQNVKVVGGDKKNSVLNLIISVAFPKTLIRILDSQ